jgi:hypothetical protein
MEVCSRAVLYQWTHEAVSFLDLGAAGRGSAWVLVFDDLGLEQADGRLHQALSRASPTVPMDPVMPASRRRRFG